MALLARLNDEIKKKRPYLKKKKHQDNELCHKTIKTTHLSNLSGKIVNGTFLL
jgi:hypothetical protein